MRRFLLPAQLGFALVALSVHAEPLDRVAAVVNNDIIALSEVEQRGAPELARVASERDPTKRGAMRADILKRAVDSLIGEKLLEAEFKELNIDVTEQDIDLGIEDVRKQNNLEKEQFDNMLRAEGYTMASYRQFMKKHLAKLKLINLKVRNKVKVTDEDLKVEYAKISRMESEDAELHARHVLVQLPANPSAEQIEAARLKAQNIAEEARQPGVDFAALAKRRSEGPSAQDGGDLGFFRRGVMVAEFERTAFALPVGGVSEPVRTKFGWHVIKIEERRAVAAKPFSELKDQLRERLMRDQLEKYTDQYVNELRQKAIVEVKI